MVKPKFSIVTIARNEAKTLPKMVGSLKKFQCLGGEIVIVDTGSTDGTPDVARSLGCTVFEAGEQFILTMGPFVTKRINDMFIVEGEEPIIKEGDRLFDYAAARNAALTAASNDMIAIIDCDETFTALNVDAVNDAVDKGYTVIDAPYVYSHDQYGHDAIKFTRSRFYDRRVMKWTGVVHETLTGRANTVTLTESDVKVEHWQNTETNRSGYLRGLAYACLLHPENDRNSHYLGRELLGTGRPKSAIHELQRHVDMYQWAAERAQSIIYMGDAHIQLGNVEIGLNNYHWAFQVDSSRRESLMRLALYYWRQVDHQRAAAYAAAALTVPWTPFYSNNVAEYEQLPHEILYWALWYLGNKEEAKLHWEKAIAYQPNNPKYLHDSQFFSRGNAGGQQT